MLSYNLESSDLPSPLGVKAHSTQGMAASKAFLVLQRCRVAEFPEGNIPGYVCKHGSQREWDAASQGHTSGIPTRAMLHP